MSEKEETVAPEDFVDPNSGRSSQPGSFASAGVAPEAAGADVGANVPENDPELPAKADADADNVPEIEGVDNGDGGNVETPEDDNADPDAVVPENDPEALAKAKAEAEGDGGDDTEPEAEEKDYSEVLAGNVPDVEKYVNEHPDEKDAIIAAEEQGKGRQGILNL